MSTASYCYRQLKAALFNEFAPKEKNKRRKTKITDLGFDENDLWIAAIALQHNLTVVSADSDFQRIQQMKSAELKVLSAELKDRPQGAGYQPSPDYQIPPTQRPLSASQGAGQIPTCESTEYSYSYSAL